MAVHVPPKSFPERPDRRRPQPALSSRVLFAPTPQQQPVQRHRQRTGKQHGDNYQHDDPAVRRDRLRTCFAGYITVRTFSRCQRSRGSFVECETVSPFGQFDDYGISNTLRGIVPGKFCSETRRLHANQRVQMWVEALMPPEYFGRDLIFLRECSRTLGRLRRQVSQHLHSESEPCNERLPTSFSIWACWSILPFMGHVGRIVTPR